MAHILISQNSLPFRCKSEYTRDQSRFPVLARLAGARRRTSRLPERPVSATAAGLPAKDAHQSSNANALEGSQAPNSEQRYHALQPYQVSVPKRGILGSSRYAKRLRAQVVEAARDKSRRPVLIFGEPGLEKDNIAALVHFSSPEHGRPMVHVDCSHLDPSASEVFGRGSRRGLLYWLGNGTLLLSNVSEAHPETLTKLQALLRDGSPGGTRIIMTSEKQMDLFKGMETDIKVPPLRLRPGDVEDYQRFFLRKHSHSGRGEVARPQLTPEALRLLESYQYPGNILQLEAIVKRAEAEAQAAPGAEITPDQLWFAATVKDRMRLDLLATLPWLRAFLRSDFWMDHLKFRGIAPFFAAYNLLLFLGPQDRAHNVGLTLFWGAWWPGVFLLYPFMGKIWCSVCPFMVWGEIAQRFQVSRGVLLKKWPHAVVEQWGPWFLLSLFGGILEVWDLPNTASLSAWLLLLITAGAVACSAVFEHRLWCRHLCPIGGMNGMFSKLSMTELRASHGVCQGNCSTYNCYKGTSDSSHALTGCPMGLHPAQLKDNHDCVMCMQCLEACSHGSVDIRLRPPGADLWSGERVPRAGEVSLLFLLLGAVYLHNMPQMFQQAGLDPAVLQSQPLHIGTSCLVLLLPGALAAALHTASAWQDGAQEVPASAAEGLTAEGAGTPAASANAAVLASSASVEASIRALKGSARGGPGSPEDRPRHRQTPLPPFLELAYGYMPLVWGATLAHHLPLLLTEVGRILPVTAATVGLDGEWLTVAVADPAVVDFLQGALLLSGAALSLALTRKLGARPWRGLLPQCTAICGLTAELFQLLV